MTYLRMSLILLALFIVGIGIAQEATPEATAESQATEIEFAVFTLPDTEISGAAPLDWEEVIVGAYSDPEDEDNATYILHFASTESTLEELLQPILEAFAQEALPEESEIYETEGFEWALYTFEYLPTPDSEEPLVVDIATMESDTLVLAVVLQSKPNSYEALHEDVFLRAVDYFGQEFESIEADLGFGSLIPTSIEEFGIDTLTPKDWENVNPGSYVRGDLQVDPTTFLIQTSTDLSEIEFRDLFLERLGLSNAGEGESYESDNLIWTIYTVDVDLEGTLLTWQIATASDDDFSYLVVIFSFTEESEILREMILLPVLDATQVSD